MGELLKQACLRSSAYHSGWRLRFDKMTQHLAPAYSPELLEQMITDLPHPQTDEPGFKHIAREIRRSTTSDSTLRHSHDRVYSLWHTRSGWNGWRCLNAIAAPNVVAAGIACLRRAKQHAQQTRPALRQGWLYRMHPGASDEDTSGTPCWDLDIALEDQEIIPAISSTIPWNT